MSDRTKVLRGVVRGGAIVPSGGMTLPEGADVEFSFRQVGPESPIPFTPEEAAEFAGWERLGDEAWAMIDWGDGEIARDSG